MARTLDPVFPNCSIDLDVADRIAARSTANDLLVVVALPKSASTAFSRSVAGLVDPNLSGALASPREAMRQGGMTRSIAVSFSLLCDDPDLRGAWQVHAPFSHASIELLRLFRVPYVVLARHPLDHLIALACHWRKPGMVNVAQRYAAAGRTTVNTALAPAPISALTAKQVHDAVAELISCGYLFDVLSWLSNWLSWRDATTSILMRIEQLNRDPEESFERVASLLHVDRSRSADAAASYRRRLLARTTIVDTEVYPGGWTGANELWRSYCTENELAAYNRAVESFLAASPRAQALTAEFDDLLVPRMQDVSRREGP